MHAQGATRLLGCLVGLATAAVLLTGTGAATATGPAAAEPARSGRGVELSWGRTRLASPEHGESWLGGATALPHGSVALAWTWALRGRVQVATRSPDGAWSTPTRVGRGGGPGLATDGRGGLTVVWTRATEARRDAVEDVVTRYRTPGGRWQPTVTLTRPSRSPFAHPWETFLAVDAAGDTVVAWTRWYGRYEEESSPRTEVAYRSAGRRWGRTVTIDRGSYSVEQLLIDRDGDATLFFAGRSHRSVGVVRYVPGTGWSGKHVLVRHRGQGYVSLEDAVGDDRGDEVIVLRRHRAGPTQNLWALRRPSGRKWLPAAWVGTASSPAGSAAMGPRGGVAVLFAAASPTGGIRATGGAPRGTWTLPRVAVPAGAPISWQGVQVVRDRAGDQLLTWVRDVEGDEAPPVLWASYRPDGGSWSAPSRLTGPRTLEIGRVVPLLTESGDGVVAWDGGVEGTRGTRVWVRELTVSSAQ